MKWLIAVLALVMLVAPLIPGAAWADHSSDDRDRFEAGDEFAAREWFEQLLEMYSTGELEYNEPGR